MKAIALIATIVLCFSVAQAQQFPKDSQSSGPAKPIQPLTPLPGDRSQAASLDASLNEAENAPPTSAQVKADTHVLSSAETLGLGSLRGFRNIFDPAIKFSELDETGLVPGKAALVSNLGGSLYMDQHWGSSDLAVAYNAADVLYQPSYYGMHSVPYHDLNVSSEMVRGRWTVRLRDSALYSWETGFGGLFTGGPAQFAQSGLPSNIQPSLAPNQTIQTGLARQLNNTALGEADYAFSRRTTLTFVGSYGLLHFSDPGYINSRSINGKLGYNYALSAANSFSLSYDYNRVSFSGTGSRMQIDSVQISFGRKITGRLALQLEAGPQLLRENYGAPSTPQLSWSTSNALTYNLPTTGYSLSYFRGVTAGSGVFFGSESDTVTATASHEFTRFWSASVNGGYAVNKPLGTVSRFVSRFDGWFTAASLNRQMGRQVHVSLTYGLQRQTTGGGACPVLSCGLPGSTSFRQFGATLQWHPLAGQAR